MKRGVFENKGKVLVLNLELLEVLGQGKINESIVLQQIHYWIKINEKKNQYYVDGNYWYFSSYNDMLENDFKHLFKIDTLKRVIGRLENDEFLFSEEYKNKKIYRINYKKIDSLTNLKLDKKITKKEKSNPMQIAPMQNAQVEDEVDANCTGGYAKCTGIPGAKCTDRGMQNAHAINKINKINDIYIKYNTFINKVLSNNSDVTDKDNLLLETEQYNFWFSELKQDVELAKEKALNKHVGSYRIDGEDIEVGIIHEVLSEVNTEQINYCTEKILNAKHINNFEKYVVASLYNSVLKNKNKNIKIFEKVKDENSLLGKYSWM